MSTEEKHPPTDSLEVEQDCTLPRHPFFDIAKDQASFVECIDAIDRVRAVIELCDFLGLDDNHGGLSPRAAFGYYWINVLMQSTLAYVSSRLMVLNKQKTYELEQESAYLSALVKSIDCLGRENREHFLSNAAAQMNVKRSTLDKFVRKRTKQ